MGGPSRAVVLALAQGVLGAGAAACSGSSTAPPVPPRPVEVEVPQPGSPGPAVEPAPDDVCPSEEARVAVTACPDGPAPTYEDFRHALGMADNDRRWLGLYPHSHTGPGEQDLMLKQAKQPLSGRPLSPWEKRLVELARVAACGGGTTPGKSGQFFAEQEALYFVGSTYFGASRWEEAAAAFHLAVLAPQHEITEYSALLALEALDALARRDGRMACMNALRERAALYERRLCTDHRIAGEASCGRMRRWAAAPP